jgi:hypothetical protein
MLLEKISDHYEDVLLKFYDDYVITKTNKGLQVDSEIEGLVKLHAICKNIPEDLLLNHVETIVLYAKAIRTPYNLLHLIDEYQDQFKETYFIDVKKEYQYFRFDIFHKKYDYKVFTFIDNHDNEDTIRGKLDEFLFKDVKLPDIVIKKIFEDIETSFLDGYDIDLSNYAKEVILASNDKTDLMVIYTNKLSGKQISIHPIQINEQTGDVFFAGKFDNLLRL